MGGKYSKLMDEVNEVTAVMKDTVTYVQKSVKNLAGVHGMKEALKQAARVRDQLHKEGRDALETLFKANSQVSQAVHFARVAVRTCKSIVETVRRVITAEKGKISDKLKSAIHIYVKRVKELMPQLEKARDELAQTKVGLKKAISGFEIFKEWCNLKISEMEGKAELEVVKQRAIAYGGAPGATVGVAGVVLRVVVALGNCWKPGGWVASAVTIGGAAVVAEGVAAVVTEGKTVGDLRKEYGRGITSLNEATKSFQKVSKNTEESVLELERNKKQLEDIVAVAQQSAVNGEMPPITCDENIDVGMFDLFKEDVVKLEKLCDDYLNAPDMPKDDQEEETKA